MTRKPDSASKALDDAFKTAVHKAANNPLAPERVRESMKHLEKDLRKK